MLDLFSACTGRVALQHRGIDFQKWFSIRKMSQNFMRPWFMTADVEGSSKGFNAVEAPRSAVVGRIGSDKIGYWRLGVSGVNK